jgi:hypothetical protein
MSYLGDLANSVWEDLDRPSTILVENIHGWFVSNVGKLNTYTTGVYSGVNGTGIEPEPSSVELALLAQLYKIRYYERKVDEYLGAGAYTVMELKEGDTTIRIASRNELAKTYKDLKKQEQDNFHSMLQNYKASCASPLTVDFE